MLGQAQTESPSATWTKLPLAYTGPFEPFKAEAKADEAAQTALEAGLTAAKRETTAGSLGQPRRVGGITFVLGKNAILYTEYQDTRYVTARRCHASMV